MGSKFSSDNIYKPTKADIERNRNEHAEYDRLGINMSILYEDSKTTNNKDKHTKNELKAIYYITRGKKVPKKLEDYLLSTKDERLARYPKVDDEDGSFNLNITL